MLVTEDMEGSMEGWQDECIDRWKWGGWMDDRQIYGWME